MGSRWGFGVQGLGFRGSGCCLETTGRKIMAGIVEKTGATPVDLLRAPRIQGLGYGVSISGRLSKDQHQRGILREAFRLWKFMYVCMHAWMDVSMESPTHSLARFSGAGQFIGMNPHELSTKWRFQ